MDDLIFTGDEDFERSKKLDESIKMKEAQDPPETFADLHITKEDNGGYSINQAEYIRTI